MTSDFLTFWHFFYACISYYLRKWTKPVSGSIMAGSLLDLRRSRTHLIAENVMLGQQLIMLNRQVKQPQLTDRDRMWLVLLSRFAKYWQQTIYIVQPDTILRWHRELFQLYWTRKSKSKKATFLKNHAGDIWSCDFTVVSERILHYIDSRQSCLSLLLATYTPTVTRFMIFLRLVRHA
jgi:hypothetical protein